MDGFWRLLRFVARSTRRLAILVVGLGVVAVGIVLIPAPGPGWLVVFAGLALLATEFTWAEILLERAKRQVTTAKNLAVRSVTARRRTTVAGEAVSANGMSPGDEIAAGDDADGEGAGAVTGTGLGELADRANGHGGGELGIVGAWPDPPPTTQPAE